MGWLWSSSSDSALQPSAPPASSSTPTSTANAPIIPPNAPLQSQSQSQSQLPAQATPHPDADYHAAFPQFAPQTASEPNDTKLTKEYPSTMSCRAAFDSAFYCSSLGGHFNDVYRFGELRTCSEHWADWRFCMGLKTRTKDDKALLIQERYREKEELVRSKANSEDVWDRRAEGERHFGAFKPSDE